MASNLTVQQSDTESNNTYHKIPSYRNKDQQKKRLPLELLHQRLGHRKCRTLLAASEHQLWENTNIRMTGETGCLTCGLSTIRSRARNKEPHTGATRPGEYLFLDIQHPLVRAGLTMSTCYPFYLLIVDVYYRYVKLYGIPKKSTDAVITALKEYQADHSIVGSYGYLDIERIRTDAGSQLTSPSFADLCTQHGIRLSLAAPKKQYQNHLAERTWQTVTSTARALLVHARLPDTFWFHALMYSTYIFNALPIHGLSINNTDVPSTPHELFFGRKPSIAHLRVFGCPVVIRKWTSSDHTNGKQTERGIRGIFIGLDIHQKGYVIYSPGSWSIVVSDDVLFDEQFYSPIALTWQKFQDGIALRPLASFIPDFITTIEHTGTISTALPTVEKGNLIHLDNEPEAYDPNMPDLVPHNSDDDASTADYDDDSDASSTSSETSDDASLSDKDLLDMLEPVTVEPEPDTPQVQPLRRSTRHR
jgi:hypothetical protein